MGIIMPLNTSDFQLLAGLLQGLLQIHDIAAGAFRLSFIAPASCATRSIATAPDPHTEPFRSEMLRRKTGRWADRARVRTTSASRAERVMNEPG
ncbi:MAG: hypothetical protein KGY48_07215 [Wenzhouxiangellaceae bacterium]|nr:hypothetical protein [Wenzhouxiangellaceae bacterium]MBS3747233.1 hypothetical protein [Wenzhouxiangellaceae bacterium]MBS3823241.1 hypothetical protein [Wenzhouxiangellaceae bacterium]